VQKLIPQVDLYFTQLHPCRQRCLDGIIENNPETESLFFVRQQRQVEICARSHLYPAAALTYFCGAEDLVSGKYFLVMVMLKTVIEQQDGIFPHLRRV